MNAEVSGTKRDRGLLRVDANECKGCGLCIEACPPKAIHLSDGLNHYGYRTATYNARVCTRRKKTGIGVFLRFRRASTARILHRHERSRRNRKTRQIFRIRVLGFAV